MGAGRKKETLSMGEKIQRSPGANASVSARNLRTTDLGAIIFGCTHSTIKECFATQLFGLPAMHLSYVKNVRPGLPLFLFNYSDRKMHGIFEAASDGRLNINIHAWTDGFEITAYPAQVRIRIRKKCRPLSEDQYKQILIDNYYGQNHFFWFELDHAQTGALLSLFESLPMPTALTYKAPTWESSHETSNNSNGKESSNSRMKLGFSDNARTWSSLFKEQPNLDSRNQEEKLNSITSKTDCIQSDNGDLDNMGEWFSLPMLTASTYNAPTQRTVPQSSDNCSWDEAFSDDSHKWSSLFKELPTADLRTLDEKSKSIISETKGTNLGYGEMEEWHKSMDSERDEENDKTQHLKTHSDKQGMDNEEERIYLKLKKIAINRSSNAFLEDQMEEPSAPCRDKAHWEDEENDKPQLPEIHSDKQGMNNKEERIYLKLKQMVISRGSSNTFREDHMEEPFAPCADEAHLEEVNEGTQLLKTQSDKESMNSETERIYLKLNQMSMIRGSPNTPPGDLMEEPFAPCTDEAHLEDEKNEETHSDKDVMNSEEERIYLKLKQIKVNKGRSNTFPEDHMEEGFAPSEDEAHLEDEKNEETHLLVTHSDKDGMNNEEERIYLKLKQIKVNKGRSNTFPEGHMEEGSAPSVDEAHLEDERNEETHLLETHSDKDGMNSEEEHIYLKVKQIKVNKGRSNTFPEGHMEEGFAPCMNEAHLEDEYSSEAPTFPDKCDMEEACAHRTMGEAHLENEYFPEARSIPIQCEDVPLYCSNIQSVINQLRGELEDLKDLYIDECRKTRSLEKKQACSDVELQQLRDHVKLLVSELKNSSTSHVSKPLESWGNERFTESSDEPQLGMKELIFIMGGCGGDGTWLSTSECYSTSRDIVQYLKPMSSTRSYSSAAVSNGYIFNFGGCADPSGGTFYDTVDCYDPWNNHWTSCPPLSERKACLASATLHDKIYAFGGGGGYCSSTVEMFDPALGRWLRMQSMLQKRFSSAAAELNGVLYVVGGYDGNYLNSTERYDPRVNSWCMIQSMNIRRGSHSLAVLNEKLYALGGFEEIDRMVPSVEVFDPRIGSWVIDYDMNQSRGYCFAPVIGGTIYAIGGMKQRGVFADTVECYKEGHGWSITNLKALGERSFFSAAVL